MQPGLYTCFFLILIGACIEGGGHVSESQGEDKSTLVNQGITIRVAADGREYVLRGDPATVSVFEDRATGNIAKVELAVQGRRGDESVGILLSPLATSSGALRLAYGGRMTGDSQIVAVIAGLEVSSGDGQVSMDGDRSTLAGSVEATLHDPEGHAIDLKGAFSGPWTVSCFAAGSGAGLSDDDASQETWYLDTELRSAFCRNLDVL